MLTTTSGATNGSTPRAGGPYAVKPEPPANPQFLPETQEIQIEHWDYYWKTPTDNHNTSWVPRINFDVFYVGSTKLRFKADYLMPDGIYADNGIAKQSNLTTNKIILPVKVGTVDKWNAVNAKAMGFYGNPVTGLP